MSILRDIPPTLAQEAGYPVGGDPRPFCSIRRADDREERGTYQPGMTVGEFLSDPANQSGTWLIDGGWGGPPGPIHVRWNGEYWENGGYCGYRFNNNEQ